MSTELESTLLAVYRAFYGFMLVKSAQFKHSITCFVCSALESFSGDRVSLLMLYVIFLSHSTQLLE
jgi:hypothetical protein